MGAIALLVLDGAGWHISPQLNVLTNIVPLLVPPYPPEFKPNGKCVGSARTRR